MVFIIMIAILPFLAAPLTASVAIPISSIECPSVTPHIEVIQQTRPLEFVRHLSAASLTDMQKRKGFFPHASKSYVQGLGGGAITLSAEVTFTIYGDDVKSCLAVKSVEGAIISAPTLHIARNYKERTCEYNAVLEHEMKHVKILNDFRAEYAPKFEAELERLAKIAHSVGPIASAYIQSTQARKHEIIEGGIKKYADEITAVMLRRQLAIDTVEEYERTHSQCNNWDNASLATDTRDGAPVNQYDWHRPKPVYTVRSQSKDYQSDTQSLYEQYPPQIPPHRREIYNH